ncbi:hypothetical protein [Massilia scottii]|uniref:hypothetical protein n=1 Tax=Massilia scottii TaxID=3057166 RepID=UPI00279652DD|nr:hypothetical protein [Massilia sp. CCM 9029]MDQ1831681.1 hypothetical protein [Massilia sp. CCM 9029]
MAAIRRIDAHIFDIGHAALPAAQYHMQARHQRKSLVPNVGKGDLRDRGSSSESFMRYAWLDHLLDKQLIGILHAILSIPTPPDRPALHMACTAALHKRTPGVHQNLA